MSFYNTREPNSFREITGSIWELSASSGTSCLTLLILLYTQWPQVGTSQSSREQQGSFPAPEPGFPLPISRQAGQAVCNLCLGSTVVSPLWRDWKAVDATTRATPPASLGLWGQAGLEQARLEPWGFAAAPPGRMLSPHTASWRQQLCHGAWVKCSCDRYINRCILINNHSSTLLRLELKDNIFTYGLP